MKRPKGNILTTALQLATEHRERDDLDHTLVAVIFKGKRVVSFGHNDLASRKKLLPEFQKWHGSIHAEVMAINKAKRDLNGFEMIVLRVNKDGDFRMARPCKHCWRYIKYAGIKGAHYSIGDPENIVYERTP